MREEMCAASSRGKPITRSLHLEKRYARSGRVNFDWQAYGVVLRMPCLEMVESGDGDLMPSGGIHQPIVVLHKPDEIECEIA